MLYESGFSIRISVPIGFVDDALKRIKVFNTNRNRIELGNIVIEELLSIEDLDCVMSLWREEFRSNPQYHMVECIEDDLIELRSKILKDINQKRKCRYVLKFNDKVIGYFGYDIWVNNSMYGCNVGGSDLCFSKQFQGIGLLPEIYYEMLKSMKANKMELISGGTAQKPVSYTHLTLPTTPYV